MGDNMTLLKRKIDSFLEEWKADPERLPLIVKGARQIGKTESIRFFAQKNYKNIIEINFVLNKEFCDIFDDGFKTDSIIKNISLRNPELEFTEGETLIFFDELQACPNCATSLKFFKQDGRYDVVIVETADYVDDSIALTDISQEFITKAYGF